MHNPRVRATLLTLVAITAVLLLVPTIASAGVARTNIPLDGTQDLRGVPAPYQVFPNGQASGALAQAYATEDHGTPDLVLTLFDQSGIPEHGGTYQVPFWKEYTGTHSDVYVAWNDLAAPPQSYQQDQTITADQIGYLGDQFDTRIWASDVAHFGWYDFRTPTTDGDGSRAAIMVYNIRDQAYWLNDYPWYIAGYFWGGLNDEIQMNAIFVDSYNWADRVGGDVARPYLYEGTIAHEFEHLIHNDVDPNEDSFIDEGMASMAGQFIYGAASSTSDLAYALYYNRDSLTDWDSELYDYGNTEMWQDYLWEQASRGSGPDAGNLFAPLSARIKEGWDPFVEDPAKFVDPGDAFSLQPHPRAGQRPRRRGERGRRHGQRREAAPRLDARQPAGRQGHRAGLELRQLRPGRTRLRVHHDPGRHQVLQRRGRRQHAADAQERVAQRGHRAVGRVLPQLLR